MWPETSSVSFPKGRIGVRGISIEMLHQCLLHPTMTLLKGPVIWDRRTHTPAMHAHACTHVRVQNGSVYTKH